MTRSIARARAGRERTSLYQEITDKIITELEVPSVQPWRTVAAKAPLTMLILWGAVIDRGFSTLNWLTFRQALRLGGNVRKGERGTTVVYADHFVPDEERRRAERAKGELNAIQFLKRFAVFNTDQCEDFAREVHNSESTTHRLAQAILFIACDALGTMSSRKRVRGRDKSIIRWPLDFDGTIMFGESDAVHRAAGENSECRAHDNLNAIPLAASSGDKAAA